MASCAAADSRSRTNSGRVDLRRGRRSSGSRSSRCTRARFTSKASAYSIATSLVTSARKAAGGDRGPAVEDRARPGEHRLAAPASRGTCRGGGPGAPQTSTSPATRSGARRWASSTTCTPIEWPASTARSSPAASSTARRSSGRSRRRSRSRGRAGAVAPRRGRGSSSAGRAAPARAPARAAARCSRRSRSRR